MLADMRERARSEGGFTLIELLVVMIIISILMAVAVPTFLAQKNNAQKTKATANIKQIVNAIEACASTNTDGTYNGCTSATQLTAFEKGLKSIKFGAAPAVGTYSITPNGTQGYSVQTAIQDGNKTVYFAENHLEDGNLAKVCGGAAIASTATTGAAVADSRTCPPGGANAGKWG